MYNQRLEREERERDRKKYLKNNVGFFKFDEKNEFIYFKMLINLKQDK